MLQRHPRRVSAGTVQAVWARSTPSRPLLSPRPSAPTKSGTGLSTVRAGSDPRTYRNCRVRGTVRLRKSVPSGQIPSEGTQRKSGQRRTACGLAVSSQIQQGPPAFPRPSHRARSCPPVRFTPVCSHDADSAGGSRTAAEAAMLASRHGVISHVMSNGEEIRGGNLGATAPREAARKSRSRRAALRPYVRGGSREPREIVIERN